MSSLTESLGEKILRDIAKKESKTKQNKKTDFIKSCKRQGISGSYDHLRPERIRQTE